MASSGRLIAAFLVGAAAGAGIGLLLAPVKGEETRDKLKVKLDYLNDKGKTAYKEFKEKKSTDKGENLEM